MARSVRDGSRRDTTMFLACILLALLVRALDESIREPIASALRQTFVAPLLHLQRGAERTRSAWLDYERLTASRDSIAVEAMETVKLEAENERLRRLLGLGAKLDWGFIPAEALHGQAIGEETTITLAAGANAGVTRYAPVVAPEGLVGRVETVDPTMSVAFLWTHPQFRTSAMAADGSAFGIVYPHAGDCPFADGDRTDCPERFLLELRGVQFRNALDTGTVIVTAGLGGVFPEGITIGTVIAELKRDTELWSRTYLVRPAVRPPDVRTVIIMTEPRADRGVKTVWTPQRAEGMARRAALAGDSIAALDRAVAAATEITASPAEPPPGTGPGQAPRQAPSASAPPRRVGGAGPATPPVRPADSTAPPARATDSSGRSGVATLPTIRPDSIVTTPPVLIPPPVVPPPPPPQAGTGSPPPG